jgi:light-regulated signal transduction histidine kinase (bacteriophytochrome)
MFERHYISGIQFIKISEQERIILRDYLDAMSYHSRPPMSFLGNGTNTQTFPFPPAQPGEIREEIPEINEGLERRTVERMAKLERTIRELEAFSYSICHDLHSPLLAIEGLSRRLLERYSTDLDAKGQQLINLIHKDIIKMEKLTEDLLTFYRSGHQPIQISEIDIAKLVQGVVQELKAIHPRQIVLDVKDLPHARGDREMITRLFFNLLSNAFKFTRDKETAIIEICGRVEEVENLYYVKDNGVGFEMQYANRLFSPFQRLHSREEFEGTGIGLAIVQGIVRQHGGRVWAEGRSRRVRRFTSLFQRGELHEYRVHSLISKLQVRLRSSGICFYEGCVSKSPKTYHLKIIPSSFSTR